MRENEVKVPDLTAVPRWTGAWQTMLVYVDRKGGLPVDDAFRRDLLRYLVGMKLVDAQVHVVPMKNYRRSMWYDGGGCGNPRITTMPRPVPVASWQGMQ